MYHSSSVSNAWVKIYSVVANERAKKEMGRTARKM
jgi:hypothetical protein